MPYHEERAKEIYAKGCNCAQAVLGGFSERTGLDETLGLKLASSFGGGVGGMKGLCGAVSGACMALGCVSGYAVPTPSDNKPAHNQRVQRFAKAFEEEFGSIVCAELLAKNDEDGTTAREAKPCERYVAGAARILAAQLAEATV